SGSRPSAASSSASPTFAPAPSPLPAWSTPGMAASSSPWDGGRGSIAARSGESLTVVLPILSPALLEPAMPEQVVLSADSNQALGLGRFAVDFMNGPPDSRGQPDPSVLDRTNMFHIDA